MRSFALLMTTALLFVGCGPPKFKPTKPTERALSGTESGARFAGRVPLGWSPSLHHLRRPALGIVRQLHR